VTVLIALAGALLRRRLLLITVVGTSMEPAYTDGDRVLVRRTTLAGVRRGAVVVLAAAPGSPASDPPLRMKRAAAVPGDPVPPGIPVADRLVPPGRLVVLGDNAERSADSRTAGFLPATDVVGIVIRRLRRR
jgi:signal peptidase I